jgi:hypothetical protein
MEGIGRQSGGKDMQKVECNGSVNEEEAGGKGFWYIEVTEDVRI